MKKIILGIIIFMSVSVSAQVKFEALTDRDTYGLNERFQLVFSINNEGDNFQPPKIPNFKVEGPIINKGYEDETQYINGRTTYKRKIFTNNKKISKNQ